MSDNVDPGQSGPVRSYLYVPGDRPDMLKKSLSYGADAIIADLEDAVLVEAKEVARRTVVSWLQQGTGGSRRWVRVNSHPRLRDEDLRAVAEAPTLAGVVIAKVESRSSIESVAESIGRGIPLQPLIESAPAVLALPEIASASRVESLQLGEADLSADLGTPFESADDILSPIRLQVVVASASAGIGPPVAPVSTNFRDLERFERSTTTLRRLGYGSRALIHPAQVEIANRVFTPSAEEVESAERILRLAATREGGVFVDDSGRMVDEAVLRSARRVVALVRQHTSDETSEDLL